MFLSLCYFFLMFTHIIPQIAPMIAPKTISVNNVTSKLKLPANIEKTKKAKKV